MVVVRPPWTQADRVLLMKTGKGWLILGPKGTRPLSASAAFSGDEFWPVRHGRRCYTLQDHLKTEMNNIYARWLVYLVPVLVIDVVNIAA